MVVRRSWLIVLAPLCLVAVLGFAVFAQPMGPMGQYPSSLLSGLRWRDRSEERRVGKEGRYRGAPDDLKKKEKWGCRRERQSSRRHSRARPPRPPDLSVRAKGLLNIPLCPPNASQTHKQSFFFKQKTAYEMPK